MQLKMIFNLDFHIENIELADKGKGYTKLTLPVEYGGEGATVNMVILQSYLGT